MTVSTRTKENAHLKQQIHDMMGKIQRFLDAVKEELKEHPDFVADPMSISHDCISVVLNRYKNGVKHSMYLEVRLP